MCLRCLFSTRHIYLFWSHAHHISSPYSYCILTLFLLIFNPTVLWPCSYLFWFLLYFGLVPSYFGSSWFLLNFGPVPSYFGSSCNLTLFLLLGFSCILALLLHMLVPLVFGPVAVILWPHSYSISASFLPFWPPCSCHIFQESLGC
jgi:hypothetical protein